MRIETIPKIKVTSEEKHITIRFCEMCNNFDEKIYDWYENGCDDDDLYPMMEKNIELDWHDFMNAVNLFASFIKSCEED